jgi:hypothetical protein
MIKRFIDSLTYKIRNLPAIVNNLLYGTSYYTQFYTKRKTYVTTEYHINANVIYSTLEKPRFFPMRFYTSNFYPTINTLFENENFKGKRYSVLIEILDNDLQFKRRVSLSGYSRSENNWEFYRRINRDFAIFEEERYKVTALSLIISKIDE